MKTLVYGLQSSGASFVTFCLSQEERNCVTVVDLFYDVQAPPLSEEAAEYDVLMKCVVTKEIPLEKHIESFQPDKLLLVTRDLAEVKKSLETKHYRDYGGSVADKISIFENVLKSKSYHFDEIISYESIAAAPPVIKRDKDRILVFNNRCSDWCRENYDKKWGFGGLRDVPPSQFKGKLFI